MYLGTSLVEPDLGVPPDRHAPLLQLPPPQVDVAIVGAGLSGALLALTLARRGVSVAVIDETATFKSDFRCEKLNARQEALLRDLGVHDILRAAIAPAGRLTDVGFRYDQLVNAVRAAWPASVRFIPGRVADVVARGNEDQRVMSAQGALADARLVVLATGPSPKLAGALGLTRRTLRRKQSIAIGFTLAPEDGGTFDFDGLVAPGARAGDKVGLASLFRVGETMRVNLFCYHDPLDPWVRAAKTDPLAALRDISPRLARKVAGARLVGRVEMRGTDLYQMDGEGRAGLVLIGDAFQSSCPATGFGVTKLLTDIRQLVHDHIPAWLATPGMDADKIAAFYADPSKIDLDQEALHKAAKARAIAVETTLRWRAYRVAAQCKRMAAASVRRLAPNVVG